MGRHQWLPGLTRHAHDPQASPALLLRGGGQVCTALLVVDTQVPGALLPRQTLTQVRSARVCVVERLETSGHSVAAMTALGSWYLATAVQHISCILKPSSQYDTVLCIALCCVFVSLCEHGNT